MISRQLAWDAVRPLLVGLILGLAATVFVGQLLRRMLYGLGSATIHSRSWRPLSSSS